MGTDPSAVSLYERLGREDGIVPAVDEFYVRVLRDAPRAFELADAELSDIKRHQVLVISQLTGGPKTYATTEELVEVLGKAHAHLGITPDEYAIVGKHLLGVLRESGVPTEEELAGLGETLDAVAPVIVTAGT
jgi:hemoglobin